MLSIIILNYNQKNLCQICLKNVFAADLKLDYEIIITDNASTDGSDKYFKELKQQHPILLFYQIQLRDWLSI